MALKAYKNKAFPVCCYEYHEWPVDLMLCRLENDTIYWVDMGLSTISRAKRDQTWREDVVTNGIGRVEGIAVDWIAG